MAQLRASLLYTNPFIPKAEPYLLYRAHALLDAMFSSLLNLLKQANPKPFTLLCFAFPAGTPIKAAAQTPPLSCHFCLLPMPVLPPRGPVPASCP